MITIIDAPKHDVLVTAIGEFGTAIAQRLSQKYEVRLTRPVEIGDSSRWPHAKIHVVAAWREVPGLFDTADRLAFVLRRPWLPITLDATSARIGPLVTGGRGPCYRCYLARQYQHSRLRDMDRTLFAAYERDPTCGIGGFLPAHVTLATVAAGRSIDAVLCGDAAAERGRVRRFGLLTPQWSTDSVVPVDSCDRCDVRSGDASWSDLSRDMGSLRTNLEVVSAGAGQQGGRP